MNAPDLFMKRNATHSLCGRFRWTLTREWGDGPTCCYIGHNPSTAGSEVDDPTSQAWVHFAKAQGFGRYIAVNLYPYRSPDPKECHVWARSTTSRWALDENVEVVAREVGRACRVVACWGALPDDQDWVEKIVATVHGAHENGVDIYCLGTTLAGDPKHPMARGKHRIPRYQQFTLWREARTCQSQ